MAGSLDSLVKAVQNDELKFVFVGGKGGVGKTTSSSAIASLFATVCNKRVLLVSTDPAHSLGDAWRTSFSNVPTSPMFNLDVMEIDPKETMDKELNTWVQYAKEFEGAGGEDEDAGGDGDSKIMQQIASFQDWLSGIPGIDEATALSSAITYIESGKYDLIVFDTAPTGHTLKLLALPEILEKGIDKLQSWQTTLWSYWDVFKGLSAGAGTDNASKKINIKEDVSQKLTDYKHSIQKVATMLQDQTRTRFVVVCIAEFLSVSETQRLLQELVKNKVRASHVIVNQLVVEDALSSDELTQLEAMAEVGNLQMDQTLLKKTVHACRLTTARKGIQQKYLGVLKGYDETQGLLDGVCEVPLLAEEVTGIDAIGRFSRLLVTDGVLGNDDASSTSSKEEPRLHSPEVGDIVRIMGLGKADYLNGIEGKVISDMDATTGRYGVSIVYQDKAKKLALQPKNISIVRTTSDDGDSSSTTEPSKKQQRLNDNGNKARATSSTADGNGDAKPAVSKDTITKAMGILDDPEIKEMIAKNPRVKAAVEDVVKNPANFMKYLSDPELSPFIMKAVSKLKM
mmetsp:Transcript_21120/g.25099  ORF Transcript_21120/g.25099 Transcript_21120/m.25099 type:complete len:568 (+) Transcript_21120:267-1970(+)|eukprot:CAMPEP_0198252776 /NCGR_PEP_ID=MMETSP1447-20131203/3252_1 /TAXON_ID=420782 /ORGANISM="Chaetoceros dichaeta, Strain CCMP1751" /LENGTH=567 /DNA_ID=CAMNT_0043938159 /DNA_START=202 /DNA_END=1905 /DNA_ORIENTATION=-